MAAQARKGNPDIMILLMEVLFLHQRIIYIYEHTDAVGFLGASSIERIPIEQPLTDAVKDFKIKN